MHKLPQILNLSGFPKQTFPTSQHQHQLGIFCLQSARNPGIIIDELYWSHLLRLQVMQFCSFYIRKIRPYISEYATHLLVQELVTSHLDCCIDFHQQTRSHVQHLFRLFDWLPVAARSNSKPWHCPTESVQPLLLTWATHYSLHFLSPTALALPVNALWYLHHGEKHHNLPTSTCISTSK